MLSFRIQPHQHVILVRRPEKQSAQFQRSLGQIGFRFEGTEIFLILYGEHDDGRIRINLRLRKRSVKDRPHALKLVGNAAALLLARVGDHYKMRARNLEPSLGLVACRGKRGGQE